MVSTVVNWIGIPRFWLTLGAVLMVAAMGLTYHNDQTLADQTLATKINLPGAVPIQDFDRTTDTNLLGELVVLAEADIDQSVLRQFGAGESQDRYLLLPLYPVSDGSRARAEDFVNPSASPFLHRPVARASASAEKAPIAVLVYDMTETRLRPRDEDALGLSVVGRGFSGNLVVVSGVAFSGALWADGTSRGDVEMAAREAYNLGAEGTVPLIAPYLSLRSSAGGTDMSEARNMLASAGLVAALFGLSLLARGLSKRPLAARKSARQASSQTQSRSSAAFFDPLLPQDEIHKAENDARKSSELSFEKISRRITPVFSRLRSRR